MPSNWEPPVPAWSADIGENCTEVVIVYLGYQVDKEVSEQPRAFHNWFASIQNIENAPIHVERGKMTDGEGYLNDFYISYWNSKESYEVWRNSSNFGDWWGSEDRLHETFGYWSETMIVPTERFETLFSSETKAGAASMFSEFRGPIQEHNYWGGMRDRIAISEVNLLKGNETQLTKKSEIDSLGKRIHLKTPKNLAIIRSAQNLSDCKSEELQHYNKEVYPYLVKGMDFIANNPEETGCVCSRFSEETTLKGESTKKTFGFAYFLTLEHLETWSHTHPTHLAIFNSFLEMAQSLEGQIDLKLWHEVSVLPEGQVFEYINCHPRTGLLPWFN